MSKKNDILKRLQLLQLEKESIRTEKRLTELLTKLYEMDVEAMDFEVQTGIRSRESANEELEKRHKRYFDQI